jgi:hypothetical protein
MVALTRVVDAPQPRSQCALMGVLLPVHKQYQYASFTAKQTSLLNFLVDWSLETSFDAWWWFIVHCLGWIAGSFRVRHLRRLAPGPMRIG